VIRVCMGTTCHIRGAGQILEQLETRLNIKAGETTPNLKFTVEVVNCVGACAMAPLVIVNEKYYGSVKISGTKKLLRGG
ncbi:MAG: NAD(P)H-dependent oxidoreductase subunit E, partial [bacterium]